MALAFDATTPPLDEPGRVNLIKAIAMATRDDETHWLEWKSTLDLAEAADQFELAKEILAMANRASGTAQLSCEGWGFVVVGASEAGVTGVESERPANLQQKLDGYLGSGLDAPHWELFNVGIAGKNVLVVAVGPPRDGDRMYTLRKEFGGKTSPHGRKQKGAVTRGAIFVRVGEKAQQASPEEIRMLENRLLDGGLEDRVMERIALACTTMDARVRFREDIDHGRAFALVHLKDNGEQVPYSIWLHPVARQPTVSQLTEILTRFRGILRPGYLVRHLVLIHPKESDLSEAHERVTVIAKRVFSNPPQSSVGTEIVVCDETFGQVHAAIQRLLIAGPHSHDWATPQIIHLTRARGVRIA